MKTLFSFFFSLLLSVSTRDIAAQGSVPGYHDPALSRNKLLREQQGEGVYKLIGAYKVKGISYLFGQKLVADFFSVKETAANVNINYDTYNQEIEFFSTESPAKPLVKTPGDIDSFVVKPQADAGINEELHFIYGPLAGSSEKAYFQVITSGKRFSLYKRYKSELGYVSDNYIQSELRQFDMLSDYFYYDAVTKKMKKIKLNLSNVTKEFKSVKDVSGIATNDDFTSDPEGAMRKIFAVLNEG
ncbi:MAG: hypothetical protein JNJ86_03050 [Chitinophagaceae bacterium]|nr:hypothetical protein [Chitinophagaceae bacterium]